MISLNSGFKEKLLTLLVATQGYRIIKPFCSGIGHILLFHRVCKKDTVKRLSMCSGMEVTPEYLEMVIRFFLKHDYDIISIGQLFDNLQRCKIKKKFVVFTFDDGYLDNFTYAYPVFKKYNIPFTIYITTGFMDGTAVLWWYSLEQLVLEKNYIAFEIDGKTLEFHCAKLKEKEQVFLNIRSIIRNSHENNYCDILQKIFIQNRIDIYKKTEELILNWQGVKALSNDSLVTIGIHTANHYCLSNLSETAVSYEIIESKKRLEFCIDREIKHFSYPFGNREEAGKREFAIVKKCGFQTAVTSRSANIFFKHRYYLESLPRITIGEDLDERRLDFLINGLMHFRNNKFKRVVTV